MIERMGVGRVISTRADGTPLSLVGMVRGPLTEVPETCMTAGCPSVLSCHEADCSGSYQTRISPPLLLLQRNMGVLRYI